MLGRVGLVTPFVWEDFILKAHVVEKILSHKQQFSDKISEKPGIEKNSGWKCLLHCKMTLARFPCLSSLNFGLSVYWRRDNMD